MDIAAVIVAAGRGSRAGNNSDTPKQYVPVGGKPVLTHTLQAFADHPKINTITVVIGDHDQALYQEAAKDAGLKLKPPVIGGATRQTSVKIGLESLSGSPPDKVLIHDAARPFIDAATIDRVITALEMEEGAIAALPLGDTLKRISPTGHIAETIARETLWRAQTPQGFHYQAILKAHRDALSESNRAFTDDAAIAEWAGLKVALVEGMAQNEKLTTAEDLTRADEAMSRKTISKQEYETRTGSGYDVHRLVSGDGVWLCGIKIPFNQRLEGHSDADVGLHALTDAILGAVGNGDIGYHFPPSDPKWKDAASDTFLRHAACLVESASGRIVNVDITIICEAPKIGPHREDMRTVVAQILQLPVHRVSIKATTSEQLGFTGRGEGIAAMATVTVSLPC